FGPRARRKARHQRAAILLHALRVLAENALDLTQQVDERGLSVARGLGKIGAAPERFAVGSEKHRERPTALLGKMMQSRHVDLVDVGAFLAVHFDVDEEIVHHLRGWRVLEALVRHDVTPMAGGVADREQDRLVGALCLGERLGSPWPPVDGVVLVLQQIGTGLAGETVFVGWSGGSGRPCMTTAGRGVWL